jgi:hypothetical protein
MKSPCCLCIASNNLFTCVFVAAGRCSPGRLLATAVFSGFSIPAFKCHVTLHSKVAVRDAFYAALVLSNIRYTTIVKGN